MSQIVEIVGPPPSATLPTLVASLFPDGNDTPTAVASSVVYSIARGVYVCTFTGVPNGTYLAVLTFTDGVSPKAVASRPTTINAASGSWTALQTEDVNVAAIGGTTVTLSTLMQSILTAQSTIAGHGGPRSLDNLLTLMSAFAFGFAVPLNTGIGATYYDKKADGTQGVPRFTVTLTSPTSFSISNIDTSTPGS